MVVEGKVLVHKQAARQGGRVSPRALIAGLAAGMVAGLVAGLAMHSRWSFAQYRLRVVRWRVQPADWLGRDPIRIVVLSRLHLSATPSGLRRLGAIVARINTLAPDMVIILGHPRMTIARPRQALDPDRARAALATELSGLTAPRGRFALVAPSPSDAPGCEDSTPLGRELLTAAGFMMLDGRAVPIGGAERGFWLLGLGLSEDAKPNVSMSCPQGKGAWDGTADRDKGSDCDDPVDCNDAVDRDQAADRDSDADDQVDRLEAARDAAFAQMDRAALEAPLAQVTSDAPVVLASRFPEVFAQLDGLSHPISVVLSGQDGGRALGIGGPVPLSMDRGRDVYGWGRYDESGRTLIVSGAMSGQAQHPRAGLWPEITLIELSEPRGW